MMTGVTGHDDLIALADEYWDAVMEANPSTATLLGDHRFDDHIEDLSVEAQDTLKSRWRDLLGRVEALPADGLDATDRVTRSLLCVELVRAIDDLDHRLTELWSDQMDGVHAGLLMTAPEVSAPTPESAGALVARYRQVGRLLDQAADRFRSGLGAGRTPARVVIERSLNQVDGYLASDLGDDPFLAIGGPEGWDGEPAWREALADAIRESIRPGFQRYRDVLANELLPMARPDQRCGLSWLGSDGVGLYRTFIAKHTTVDDLSAEQVHQIGLAEVERLAGEYAEVGGRLFGTSDLAEVFARLRDDKALRYATGDEIVADNERYMADATAVMGDWFGRLPEGACAIKEVPDFLAPDAPAGYYFPPAVDGSRPGAYFVNTYEPTERSRTETASIAYHEAIPGHHLQLAIANELTHLPLFQRQSQGNTAFAEGWALYAERLADEMGLYRDDIERLGMLAGDSWRSCRLVVDTGLHALGWSRQQAIDYVLANAPVGEDLVAVEVDRYIAIPGQALSYKVGQLEIQRLRAEAQQAQGDAFDIRAFHDAVLGSGTVSLPVLRELVG
jgi:uncharacterized protein (DUF885 family)